MHRRPRGLLGGLYEFCAVSGHPSPAELGEIRKRVGDSVALLVPGIGAQRKDSLIRWAVDGQSLHIESGEQCVNGPLRPDNIAAAVIVGYLSTAT